MGKYLLVTVFLSIIAVILVITAIVLFIVTRCCRTWPNYLRCSKCCALPESSPRRQPESIAANSPPRNNQQATDLSIFTVTQTSVVNASPGRGGGNIEGPCEKPSEITKNPDYGTHTAPNRGQWLHGEPSNRTCEGSEGGSRGEQYSRSNPEGTSI